MPWAATYGDFNKIIMSKEYLLTIWAVPGLDAQKRLDTLIEYQHVGMTYAAALTCQADIHTPPNVIAHLRRAGQSGNYNVTVTTITRGDWEAV